MPGYGGVLYGKTIWSTRTCDHNPEGGISRKLRHRAPVLVQVIEADQVRYGHDTRRIRAARFASDHRRYRACEALRQAVARRSASLRNLRTHLYRLEVATSGAGLVALRPVGSRFHAFGVGHEEHRHLHGSSDAPERCVELAMVFLEA